MDITSKINFSNAQWHLLGCDAQLGSIADIIKPEPNAGEWLQTKIPGDVNATLLHYNKIADPHLDSNGKDCYWITAKEWWYQQYFDLADAAIAKAELCLDGVDGHADIWLNEHYLGETKNAFRQFRFNIAGLLKNKNNRILIRLKSIDQILGGPRLHEQVGWKNRRTLMRKPQFSFGWDWALPLPSIGIFGKVFVELNNGCRLTDLSVQTFIDGRIDFAFEVSAETVATDYTIVTTVIDHGTKITKEISRSVFNSYLTINIPEPQLWFPNGYGATNLYDYSVELLVNGLVVDKREGRLGIRETKIVENPFTHDAGPGFSFEIEINGETIFCKGANWVPLEIWPADITREQYEFYLRKAKEANFNMLRVWGGGIYEPDIFYELCDELGIMVWQDFMFASAGYPVEFLRDEIIAEADYQLRRLRSHASIVIWCGINEDIYSWQHPLETKEAVNNQNDIGIYSEREDQRTLARLDEDPQIYTMMLRGLVSKYGLGVPYIESSPQSRDDYGNAPNSGNSHISCMKYILFETDNRAELFRQHFEQVCSFDSEFAIGGPCSEKAFKKFFSAAHLWPPDATWRYHFLSIWRNMPIHELIIAIAEVFFGKIDSLQQYVKFGQTTHLEMMRAEFEYARCDRPNSGGTMVWMYNDSRPTGSWSIIDYYRNPKPAFYAAKRACQSQLPMIIERSGEFRYFFGNDTLEGIEVKLSYGQETLQGETVWSREQQLTIEKNSTKRFATFNRATLTIPTGDFLYINAEVNHIKLAKVIYFPDTWKEISWPKPTVKYEIISQELIAGSWHTVLQLQSASFVRLCHFIPREEDLISSFSDNYFDMAANSKRLLELQSVKKLDDNSLIIGNWQTSWE